MIFRSLAYGYLGAVMAGLVVAVAGLAMGLSQDAIVSAAPPVGIVMGLMGLSLPMALPALARIRARR